MDYQRARSPEHKVERREAILAAARELAGERSVREVSLGDIARRVDLAKSNLLRYFESREDIFLQMLEREWDGWDAAVTRALAAGDDVATALASTLAARPLFCDLVSEMAPVLERNVSVARVREFEAGSLARVDALGEAVREHCELSAADARDLVAVALALTAGAWPLSHPPPQVAAMLDSAPALARAHVDFEGRVLRVLRALIAC